MQFLLHRKHWISITKTMMFMVVLTVYSAYHMKPVSGFYGQNVELFVNFKSGGINATAVL
jgi:hypothetical protein